MKQSLYFISNKACILLLLAALLLAAIRPLHFSPQAIIPYPFISCPPQSPTPFFMTSYDLYTNTNTLSHARTDTLVLVVLASLLV